MVQFMYEYESFEEPQVDMSAVAMQAAVKCVHWGYRAESFGSQVERCIHVSGDLIPTCEAAIKCSYSSSV